MIKNVAKNSIIYKSYLICYKINLHDLIKIKLSIGPSVTPDYFTNNQRTDLEFMYKLKKKEVNGRM